MDPQLTSHFGGGGEISVDYKFGRHTAAEYTDDDLCRGPIIRSRVQLPVPRSSQRTKNHRRGRLTPFANLAHSTLVRCMAAYCNYRPSSRQSRWLHVRLLGLGRPCFWPLMLRRLQTETPNATHRDISRDGGNGRKVLRFDAGAVQRPVRSTVIRQKPSERCPQATPFQPEAPVYRGKSPYAQARRLWR